MSEGTPKRGFAAMTPERLRQIASSGGVARKKAFDQGKNRGGVVKVEAKARPTMSA